MTARANNREPFTLPLEVVWKVIGAECLNLVVTYSAEIHALVLMPNHFHMLISTPEEDLGRMMNVFMSSVTRTANRLSGRSGHVFSGPYHWSLVNSSRYFGHALKYVYRNPVKAKLCARVEEYPFSTLRGLLGFEHLAFPMHLTRAGLEHRLPSERTIEQIEWLNTPFTYQADLLIRRGLQRSIFEAAQGQTPSTAAVLLDQLL